MDRIVSNGFVEQQLQVDSAVTRFVPPDAEKELRDLVKARKRAHKGQASTRKLSKDFELIGLVGEWVYEDITGVPMNRTVLSGGDGRVDFQTRVGSVDVKTFAKAYNLLREENVSHAAILVLAQFWAKPLGATLLGWALDEQMRTCPVSCRRGHEVRNHTLSASCLKPMERHYLYIGCWNRIYDQKPGGSRP